MHPYKLPFGGIKGSIGSPQPISKKTAMFRTRQIQPFAQQQFQLNNMQNQQLYADSQQRNMLTKMLSTMVENQNQNSKQLNRINQNIQTMISLIAKKWGESQKQNRFPLESKQQKIQLKDVYKQRQSIKIQKKQQQFISKSQINNYTDLFQHRFKNIDVELPSSTSISQLLKWVGQVCRRVFSVGFVLFKDGELDQRKIKIYCSQNILRNLIRLSKFKKLSPSDFESIDKCFKNELLPYFSLKYPQTEEKKSSSKFQSILIQRDTLNQNQNDLCPKSGVDFHFEEDGNYNSQIMKFLNFIISLPARLPGLIPNQNNESITLGQSFRKDISTIFESVEYQQTILEMYQFNLDQKKEIKNLKIKQDLNLSSNKGKEKQKQKNINDFKSNQKQIHERKQDLLNYKEKVEQYTSYQIGQKLNQVTPFTQYQIQTGELKLSNTALMRVATKWCSQLERCFDPNEILYRENQWRMRDGSQKYMKKRQMVALNTLLQREKNIIDIQMNKIKMNNYENQIHFSQAQTFQQLKKYSEEQAAVGQFATSIFKVNENYLIKYLNLLIHGINKALRDFQKLQRVYFYQNDLKISSKIYNGFKQSAQMENKKLIKSKLKYASDYIVSLTNIQQQIIQETPQLISFRVGDLLRSKCTSKQAQIICIYKIVEYLSTYHPDFIKILKVRNKLDQGNKDILMNIMYKNSMIVEMQLAIKSHKSKFIEFSNKFNHYFYEMKRAQFGPIMEMCSIWASHDQRAEFYFDCTKRNNKRNKAQQMKQCCKKQCLKSPSQQLISIPFRCSHCQYFYFECNFYQKHSRCLKCGVICFKCQTEQFENTSQLSKMISKYYRVLKKYQIKITKQFPMEGHIICINSKDKKIKTFKTILYKNQYYMFYYFINNKNEKELQVIHKFKKEKGKQQFQTFILSNIFLQKSIQSQQIFKLTEQQAEKQYFIPKYFIQVKRSQKKSISLISKDIKEEFFKQQTKQTKFQSVQKVNFSQNAIISVAIIDKVFPKAQLAVINNNMIERIDQAHIRQWKQSLSRLYLRENKISYLDGIGELKNLIQLDLESNLIQQFPQIILQNLRQLNLRNNKLKSLPQNFGNMKKMTNLSLSKNQIIDFPDPIVKLNMLKVLHIKFNEIKILPQSFGNLVNLEQLSASNNSFQYLPNSFGDLKMLKILLIFNNKLSQLPESFEKLKNLEQLNISYNKLKKLPKQFGNLIKLSKLWMHKNKITQFPDSFQKLNNLTRLIMQNNQISSQNSQKIFQIVNKIQNINYVKLDGFVQQQNSLLMVSFKKICQDRRIKLVFS